MRRRSRVTAETQNQISYWKKRKNDLESRWNLTVEERRELSEINYSLKVAEEMFGTLREPSPKLKSGEVPLMFIDYTDVSKLPPNGAEYIFSCNSNYEIWEFYNTSWTHPSNRYPLPPEFADIAYKIVEYYLALRPEGGRCFVNYDGAYYKDENSIRHDLIKFSLKMGDAFNVEFDFEDDYS